MKKILNKTLVIFLIICTILPLLYSNIVLAADEDEETIERNAVLDDDIILTQERAGNYVASFAINFFNNWSSENHSFDDEGQNPVKTRYSTNSNAMPNENNNTYVIGKKGWIDFVYKNALSLENTSQLPSQYYGGNSSYEKIEISDMEEDFYKIRKKDDEEDTEKEEPKTIVELMSVGLIKPGDILITTEDDYLLFVGGTKVIYATPEDGTIHPTDTGALKYDHIQNYLVEVEKYLKQKHEGDNNTNNLEEYIPKYGVKEVYRISDDALNKWQVKDSNANLIFNQRGYYDSGNKYEGVPKMGTYEGSKKVNFLGMIIKGLVAIIKFIINLTAFLVRAVLVGWIDMFEFFFQTQVLKASGHANNVSFVDKLYGISTTSYSGDRVTVESILFNKLPLTDANFFNFETAGGYSLIEDGVPTSWLYNIRENLATVYVIFRNFSIAAMLIVLIYVGIRMGLASIAKRKAQYSKMFTAWFTGLCIILFIHIFMYMVLYVNDYLVDLFMQQNMSAAEEIIGEGAESLTLYDAIRTKAYSWDFYDGTAGLIMYAIIVYYMVRFFVIYLKRMVAIYVLALFGSFVGVKYAIDKSNGRRSSSMFVKWMKDYAFNVLLQSIHCLIYVTLMSVAVKAALTSASGIIVAILVFSFILQADSIFMRMFNVKGNLLDDTNKPGELKGIWKTALDTAKTAAIGVGIVKFGRNMVSAEKGVRPVLRYALNYRDGDSDSQTQARADSKLLDHYSRKARILYGGYKDNSLPGIIGWLPIESIQERKEAYRKLGEAKTYEIKRNIYDGIKNEKSIKSKTFKRAIGVGKNYVGGTLGLLTVPGQLTEEKGLATAIATVAASKKMLKGSDRENIKLNRRLNPSKNIRPPQIGGIDIAAEKAGKDLSKARDKRLAQNKLADLDVALNEKLKELKQQPGSDSEELYKELQNTFTATNKSSISGAKIRVAVDNYINNNLGKNTLKETDLDGILDLLQKKLDDDKSDIVIDDTAKEIIKDLFDYRQVGELDAKNYAKELAEIINLPNVIPYKTKGKTKKVLQEAGDIMKEIKAINEGNRAKNKESAISYGNYIREILKNFKEV